jgi:hypothetical protein
MNNTIHIVFGSDSHRTAYSRRYVVNPIYIVTATHPEQIQQLMRDDITTIKTWRLPEEIWSPTTFACEKRVKETENIIKGYQRVGVTVVEVAS